MKLSRRNLFRATAAMAVTGVEAPMQWRQYAKSVSFVLPPAVPLSVIAKPLSRQQTKIVMFATRTGLRWTQTIE